MKLKSILAVLALVGASAAFMVGAGQSGAEGWRADFDALPATGGVARATCRFGTLARVYYDMDNAGTLELVHAVGGVELSKVVITNAAGAARGRGRPLGGQRPGEERTPRTGKPGPKRGKAGKRGRRAGRAGQGGRRRGQG